MLGIIGIVVVFAMVFGSYVMAGGKFAIIVHAARMSSWPSGVRPLVRS